MINRIFGTFQRFINNEDGTRRLVLNNLVNEIGEKVSGEAYIDDTMVISCMKLKFGDRYMIRYGEMENNVLLNICETLKTHKNPRCDIFRCFEGEFNIIGGKYKGKKDSAIERTELISYCLWLAKNSNNEVTIKNTLLLLKKLVK